MLFQVLDWHATKEANVQYGEHDEVYKYLYGTSTRYGHNHSYDFKISLSFNFGVMLLAFICA